MLTHQLDAVASRKFIRTFISRIASYEEGSGTLLQYSCLENPMDGGAWWAVVHRVAKSQTQLSDFPFTAVERSLHSLLASSGCSDKLPQVCFFSTTEVSSLTVQNQYCWAQIKMWAGPCSLQRLSGKISCLTCLCRFLVSFACRTSLQFLLCGSDTSFSA